MGRGRWFQGIQCAKARVIEASRWDEVGGFRVYSVLKPG